MSYNFKNLVFEGGGVKGIAYGGALDVLNEKLVIGLYRENPSIENGVYVNASATILLHKFNAETVNRELDKLITPVKDRFK